MGRGRRNRRGQSEGRRVEEGRRGVRKGGGGGGGGGGWGRTHASSHSLLSLGHRSLLCGFKLLVNALTAQCLMWGRFRIH